MSIAWLVAFLCGLVAIVSVISSAQMYRLAREQMRANAALAMRLFVRDASDDVAALSPPAARTAPSEYEESEADAVRRQYAMWERQAEEVSRSREDIIREAMDAGFDVDDRTRR